MEQLATPRLSGVVKVHVTPVQATVPTGGPPVPATVAVKIRVPPVETVATLLVTIVVDGVAAPAGAEDKPSQTPHVAVAITAMDVANHFFVFIDPHSPPNAPTQPRPGQGKEVDVQVNSADVPEGSPVANVQTLRLAAAAGKSSGHRPSVSASVEVRKSAISAISQESHERGAALNLH